MQRRHATIVAAGLAVLASQAHADLPPSAAGAEDARRAEVVARFDGGQITVGELEEAILAQNPYMQQRYLNRDAAQALLDKNLRFDLLAAEAERRGYGARPDVQLAVKQSAVQTLLERDFDDRITVEAVPDADVKQYYDSHQDEFLHGEERRASVLMLADEAAAKALLPRAKSADMAAFRELVRTQSTDPTNNQRGGDLHYFTATGRSSEESGISVDPAIAAAAFALRSVGDTSGVVKVGDGFAIVKLTGLRPGQNSSLAQSTETIRSRLWRERRQAAIDTRLDELKKQLKVAVHPELVDAVKLDQGPPLPPSAGLPSGFPHTRPLPPNAPPKPH